MLKNNILSNRPQSDWHVLIPMLIVLALFLTGCSGNSTKSSGSPATLPDLSPLARQPETPSYCLPTCSSNAATDTQGWQNSLMPLTQPVPPANSPTTP